MVKIEGCDVQSAYHLHGYGSSPARRVRQEGVCISCERFSIVYSDGILGSCSESFKRITEVHLKLRRTAVSRWQWRRGTVLGAVMGCKEIVRVAMPAEVRCEVFGEIWFEFEISDVKYLVKFGGKTFRPARKAPKISGRISGQLSAKFSETSVQISRLFFRKLHSAEGRC